MIVGGYQSPQDDINYSNIHNIQLYVKIAKPKTQVNFSLFWI
jgi:hypothetical protein